MGYVKLQADRLFDGHLVRENAVLLLDASGTVAGIVDRADAGDDIKEVEGWLSPGFINCHCHLELSHMKGLIPEGKGLVDFVFAVVTQRHFEDAAILEAAAAADRAMWEGGIVAVGDISNNPLTVQQKGESPIYYHSFVEVSGWLPSVAPARYERALGIAKTFEDAGLPFSLVPHAPYSVSEGLWQKLQPHFRGSVVSIHNGETPGEDVFFKEGGGDLDRMYKLMGLDNSHHKPTGKTSLQSYLHYLEDAASLLLVHNSFTSNADLDYISAKQASGLYKELYFCLCANANQYIESVAPPIEALRAHRQSIVLGTDSLASNWSLSIADEMARVRQHFPSIPLEELLRWATFNGAKALRIDDRFGSFENGKRPGVVCIDPHTLGVRRML